MGSVERKAADARAHGAVGTDRRAQLPGRPAEACGRTRRRYARHPIALLAPMRETPLAVGRHFRAGRAPVRQALERTARSRARADPGRHRHADRHGQHPRHRRGAAAGERDGRRRRAPRSRRHRRSGPDLQRRRRQRLRDGRGAGDGGGIHARGGAGRTSRARRRLRAVERRGERRARGRVLRRHIRFRRAALSPTSTSTWSDATKTFPIRTIRGFAGFAKTAPRPEHQRRASARLHRMHPISPRSADAANDTIRLTIKEDYDRDSQNLVRRSDNWPFLRARHSRGVLDDRASSRLPHAERRHRPD